MKRKVDIAMCASIHRNIFNTEMYKLKRRLKLKDTHYHVKKHIGKLLVSNKSWDPLFSFKEEKLIALQKFASSSTGHNSF